MPNMMRVVLMQDTKVRVQEVPEPVPGPGEVLVDVLACGICGSDLHCALHGADLNAAAEEVSGIEFVDLSRPILYNSPEQFAETFAHLAAGNFDVAPLLTGTVGLDGVADAFERLRSNPQDAKTLLDPTL